MSDRLYDVLEIGLLAVLLYHVAGDVFSLGILTLAGVMLAAEFLQTVNVVRHTWLSN